MSTVNPTFSEETERLLGAGSVLAVTFVVGKDGNISDIKVTKSIGGGADEAAVLAISHWKFTPGTYLENPVAVRSSFSFGPRYATRADMEQIRSLWTETTEALSRHDYYTADTLVRRAISRAPLQTGLRSLLGMSLIGLDQLGEAQTALEAEIKLDPTSQSAYRILGQLSIRQRHLDDAVTQFKKAIEINSQDHDAYTMLGTVLFYERNYSEVIPVLDKALEISPNNAKTLLIRGMALVYLGKTTDGVSELEKALSSSPDPSGFYAAAYTLADSNVELNRAVTWAQTATTIESARLQNISATTLTPAQFVLVSEIAKCWHTMGWIYFRRGEFEQARIFLEAAWYLRPRPPIGNHLGETYESLHRTNDAMRVYAMAIAADEIPTRELTPPGTVEEITERLKHLEGKNTADLSQRGKTDLEAMRILPVPNQSRWEGNAEFALTLDRKTVLQARQLSISADSHDFTKLLLGFLLPVELPVEGQLQIPRRGTLSCPKDNNECRLRFLWDEEALKLAIQEASNTNTMPVTDLP